MYLPVCPSRVWFIDRLLGAASPFTFASLPVLRKKKKNEVFLSIEIKAHQQVMQMLLKNTVGITTTHLSKLKAKRFFGSTN